MDETILFPSPNWFQVSGLAVTTDGWLIYGGPSKSLCVLKPLPPNYDSVLTEVQGFSAHVINRAHSEKIVSVDVCPEWPTKKLMLTGSADGSVKQWKIEQNDKSVQIKSTHSHDIHCQEKEEVIGVGYSTEAYGITVGDFGHVVKWDLNSNVVKSYTHFFKNFKPSCLSCSPHVKLTVAVGTKQGVVFVLDLNGPGKTLFKIRGYDEEITNLGWCPQANVVVKKPLSETEKPHNQSSASSKKSKIKDAQNNKEVIEQKPSLEQSGLRKTLPDDSFDKSQVPGDAQEDSMLDICSEQKPSLEHSCIGKTLPDDSFGKSKEQVEVQEDSMFDIYKDHEADEFGHKKYTPENVLVKEKPEKDTSNNFLAECLRLKDDILKRKVTEPEATIESLVEALDNTHMDNQETNLKDKDHKQIALEASDHIHSNLLATISKQGGVRIWSKTGKLVASCAVPNVGNKFQKNKPAQCTTLLWYKPDVLLIADGKSELLQCNPLIVESKNKLGWSLVHSLHKRGLYAIASDAPRVQNDVTAEQAESWSVWTISQERNFVRYSIENKEARSIYGTCGGYIYMLQACPYDARRIAVSVGDGAARIWETDTLERNDNKLTSGSTLMFWQNVQGKVLTVAWHPTKENLLAFATAESRVGLIDTSKSEKAARVLLPALRGGVYSLCWGEGNELYACGGGELVVYKTKNADEAPKPITVRLDNQPRQVCTIRLQNKMLVCGTQCGGVVIMQDNNPVCSIYAFSKMIHTTEWHPQQTSSSSEDSQYKNLIAVCSLDKSNSIAILEFSEKEDGTKQLSTWKTLSGHRAAVLQLSWNPHKEGLLLSTSNDCTVRVWDISLGQCVSIFGNHAQSSLSAIWCAFPQHVTKVLSGGGDCCLRLWDYRDHLPEDYDSSRHELPKREKRNKKGKKSPTQAQKAEDEEEADVNLAANLEHSIKGSKKFLLPIINRQISQNGGQGVRKIFNRYLKLKSKEFPSGAGDADNCKEFDNDFVKMFGTNCEVNEVLDLELCRHKANHNWEAFTMLCLLRGDVTTAMNEATARGTLCPFLLSLAPALSHKYWKDVTQLYLQQVDRSIAKNEEEKLCELLPYGGAVFRKMAIQLSIQDLKGAVATLVEAKLHKEAYVLCRIRYMDSIAEETLKQWADYCVYTGTHEIAAICFLALENLSKAAALLGQSDHQELLILAADIAKIAGQNTLADHMVEKQALVNTEKTLEESVEEALNELPSRIELLMKNNCDSELVNGNAALKASK